MSHIDVLRAHALGREGARRAAEEVVRELQREHGASLETRWEGDTLHAQGRGFDAQLEAGAEIVRVSARLGLPLRLLRGRIHAEVERTLDRYLGHGTGADGVA